MSQIRYIYGDYESRFEDCAEGKARHLFRWSEYDGCYAACDDMEMHESVDLISKRQCRKMRDTGSRAENDPRTLGMS